MKTKSKTVLVSLTTLIILFVGCTKNSNSNSSNNNPPPSSSSIMDTTINVVFVFQALGGPYGNFSIYSYAYNSSNQYQAGSDYNISNIYSSGGTLNYYSSGDTSHINMCTATTVVNEAMLFSKSNVAHFQMQLATYGGAPNTWESVRFDYNPSTRKITSYFYPANSNILNENLTSTSLAPNTNYSFNCKTGKWVIYCKF